MDAESFYSSLAAWLRATVLVLPLLIGCQGEPPKPTPAVEDAPDPNGYKLTKIIVAANGDITANGKPVTLDQLKARFKKIYAAGGVVWYYRNDAEDDHPNAMKVVLLGGEHKVKIVRSHQADFSDLTEEKAPAEKK